MTVTDLRDQFFLDCRQAGRQPNAETLRGWLWFSCPANLRHEVGPAIQADPRFLAS